MVVAMLAAVMLMLAGPVRAMARSTPDPGLTLVGIVLREVGPAFAVIEDPETSKAGFYRVGATVGGGRITAIHADRVTIDFGEEQTHLRLAMPSTVLTQSAGEMGRPEQTQNTPERPSGRATSPGDAGASARRPTYGVITPVGAPPVTQSAGGGGVAQGSASQSDGTSDQSTTSSSTTGGTLGGQLSFTGLLQDTRSVSGTEFSADTLRDLTISLNLSNLTGSHTQRIELYAPDGSLYQKFSGDAATSTSTRLPVGGTWITQHSLLGSWVVKVFMDRDTTPVASAGFALNP